MSIAMRTAGSDRELWWTVEGDEDERAHPGRGEPPGPAETPWYRGAMAPRQAWDLAFDPATGRRLRQEEVKSGLLPDSRWPNFFSRLVAKLQWDANGIDLRPDAEAWPGLPDERRERLRTLLASFRIADDAVSEHLVPFGPAAKNSLVAWVIFLQRRDEQRHATFFDRVAAEVLELPGDTKEERRAAAREFAPPGILALFAERLPAMAAEMEEGRADLSDGMALYHMTLEGMVLSAGQRAILTELEDGVLPGVRQGVYHVELDERWHIGFGLRCLIDARPSREFIDRILAEAEDSAAAWGDALPAEIRDMIVPMARRRMAIVVKQLDRLAAA
jgi:ribonucleoside-diphosphate reductase beta chain